MLMVQSNAHPMKTTKIKGPPPVPPRPSQSMVAEALAKTRKAVADSKATIKTRTFTKNEVHHVSSKAKTLDRNATPTKPSVSPRQTGLARVKSFIKDVISDRSSSSDEKKSSGHNSRRSSSDSSSVHSPMSNKSSESLNSKAVKTCKQILVRSLSTSNKLDQDAKCKVSKSSSFAEKTLPLRKAPPPPLSPKPKLKPMKPLPVQKSVEQKKQFKKPDTGIYALPVDAQPSQSQNPDDCYATVEEVKIVEDRLQNSSPKVNQSDTPNSEHQPNDVDINKNNNNNSLERKTSRVTEMLISEILASRNNNKGEANAVIDKGKDSTNLTYGNDSPEAVKMKDMNNHEMLIYELQTMRSQPNVPEVIDAKENDDMQCDSEDENYATASVASDTFEDDQAYAYIRDDDLKSRLRKQFRAISTMSLQGMPPLPKSLSGFADGEPDLREPSLTPSQEHPPTDLDSQLIYLKKEMGLAKFGADVTGIDTSKQLVELAKQHSSKNKRLENNLPSFILTTIERLQMINMTAKLLCDLQTRSVKTLLFRRWSPNTSVTNNINLNCRRNAHSTIDGKDFFQVKKGVSWDPEGPLKPLYVLNYIRVPYIRDSLINVASGEKFSTCLKGKKILDVGCGGGYLSEALAKLGAEVTGIDTNKEAIQYAKHHSSNNMRLANNMPAYILSTIEEYCQKYAESYDVVIASEVIDHVGEKELFVESCVRAAKPGAKIFFTTINRTRLAQFVLIFVYENIIKVIPKGAHDYNMFIKPSELKYMLEMNDCFVESTKGYFYYPFAQYWEWVNNYQFLFAIEAVKSK